MAPNPPLDRYSLKRRRGTSTQSTTQYKNTGLLMINEPNTNAVPSATPIGAQPVSPRPSTITDPVRREFGDKTGGASKNAEPAKIEDKGQVDAVAGEGHKGPRPETTTPGPGNRPQDDPSNPSKQRGSTSM